MNIIVNRYFHNDDATLSAFILDGSLAAYCVEDEPRAEKVAGETRIPAGLYKVGVRAEGGFHNRYSTKFPTMHRGMLQVMDVPGFEYILIHVGNTDDDTAGCLCIGTAPTSAIGVSSSVAAYKRLYPRMIEAALAGELTIEYRDSDL